MASILLIEDDLSSACALSRALTGAGHQLITALSGYSALKTLDTDLRIDLLLTSIVMPPGEPHGLALARMARQKRRDLAVVFMTRHPDLRAHVDGDKVLMMPLDAHLVIDAVAESLNRQRA
jgi:DNA-binding NtrC family response regulator